MLKRSVCPARSMVKCGFLLVILSSLLPEFVSSVKVTVAAVKEESEA